MNIDSDVPHSKKQIIVKDMCNQISPQIAGRKAADQEVMKLREQLNHITH